ncbi:ABC transporter permease [Neobacillus massiliamazoniensis]|uniref:Binding-protein-dependent transport systems inner membrane component n=1 Tax=Neobacillus massiliamazoniensis TaxID=1499688 RepID=A0A0U1P2K4_9BACI|nr:ABC transporter permease [Neobacillus massiliamazoniensis]CRK84495.1 binding-protein-dependent transport systems inner membrane component [Neobacillus massiliamazoniensis]
MSQEQNKVFHLHKQFIRELKVEKRWVRFYQAVIFLVFFSIWEIASRLHWIDPLIFSSPSRIWNLCLEKIQDGSLLTNLEATVMETVVSFIVSTLLGVIIAAVLWWSPMVSKILDPYLTIFNAMPKVALGPVIIVALSPGYTSIIANGVIISVIITAIVVYTSFKEVDTNYLKVLQTFGATRFQCFKEAIMPASFPTVISTLKVNVGLSWVGVIVGEFLVSTKGLGYMIIYGFQVFNFTLVFLSLLLIAVFATIMYQLIDILEKKLIKE